MSAAAVKKASPVKVRGGRCTALCTCGKGRCLCNGYEFARYVDGWATCACRHTQAVHELIEKPAA